MIGFMRYLLTNRIGLASIVMVFCYPAVALAQSGGALPLGSQTLGRAYWHVFVAYAIAWLLVAFWIAAMSRRLFRIENRINKSVDD